MSQVLTSPTTYSIRNRESWSLTTENEDGLISTQLLNPWGLPDKGDILFIWENCAELPSPALLNKTIQTLSQKNCRSGFQVYRGEDNLMYVVFGKPGLAGGMEPAEYAVTKIVTGWGVVLLGCFFSSLGPPSSKNRSIITLPLALMSGGLLQGALYVSKTPKKEFSAKKLGYAALQGAGVGFTTEIISIGMEDAFVSPNIKATKLFKSVCMAAISQLSLSLTTLEIPSLQNMVVAALSRAITSGTSGGFDSLVKSDTLNRFIVNEGIKGGANGALSTLIFNLFSRGHFGEAKKWNDDLLLAAAGGATLGVAGAALQGNLPHESREREIAFKLEEQKLPDLIADYQKKHEAYYSQGYSSKISGAYWSARNLLKSQKEKVASLRETALQSQRVLTLFHDMITALPSHLQAVDPLEKRMERLEPRIHEIDEQFKNLKERHLSVSEHLKVLEQRGIKGGDELNYIESHEELLSNQLRMKNLELNLINREKELRLDLALKSPLEVLDS